ncbi:MAG: serine hydrolase [Pseudomonadota bacterium]
MTQKRRPLLFAIAALAFVILIGGVFIANPYARVAAGYKAKNLCSEVFVARRDINAVLNADFAPVSPLLGLVSTRLDQTEKTVSASLLGLGRAQARYRPGYGCRLIVDGAKAATPDIAAISAKPWPIASSNSVTSHRQTIDALIENANDDQRAGHRAVALFIDGALSYEWYADGFSKETPFISWSMAKSVTAAAAGIAVREDLLELDAPTPIDAWSTRDDKRGAITWRHLLHMNSGLHFEEAYADPHAEISTMLFSAPGMADVAINAALDHAPGTHWSYSSGTTNILQRGLRRALEAAGRDYHTFTHEELFAPLGLSSAVFETDGVGDFVGSSYLYATARDWGKLGQLLLQDGVWESVRILPEGWTQFVTAPTKESDREYGAHFWLNQDGINGRERYMPTIPDTAYMMAGHYGQYVLVLPSMNAVFVRLGFTAEGEPMDVSGPLFEDIYALLTQ